MRVAGVGGTDASLACDASLRGSTIGDASLQLILPEDRHNAHIHCRP